MIWPNNTYEADDALAPFAPVDTSTAIKDTIEAQLIEGPTNTLIGKLHENPELANPAGVLFGAEDALETFGGKPHSRTRLSAQQARESDWYRPGINIENGIYEDELIRKAKIHDKMQDLEVQLSNMPNTFTANAARLGAQFAAQFADPLEDVALFAAPELVGTRAAPFIYGIKNKALSRLAAAGLVGVPEAAIISAPEVVSKEADEDDVSIGQILSMVGMNAAFQGGIRGTFGFKHIVSPVASQLAKQTAINQGMSGYVQNIDNILQQGHFVERNTIHSTTKLSDPIERINSIFNSISLNDLPKNEKDLLKEKLEPLLNELAAKKIKSKDIKKLNIEKNELQFKKNKILNENKIKQNAKKLREENKKLTFKSSLNKAKKLANKEASPLLNRINEIDNIFNKNKKFIQAKKELRGIQSNYYPDSLSSYFKNIGIDKEDIINKLKTSFKESSFNSNGDHLHSTSADFLSLLRDSVKENISSAKEILIKSGLTEKDLDSNFLPKIVNDYFDDHLDLDTTKISSNTKKATEGNYPAYIQPIANQLINGEVNALKLHNEQSLIDKALPAAESNINNPLFENQVNQLNKRQKELDSLNKKYKNKADAIVAYQNLISRSKLLDKAIADDKALSIMSPNSGKAISRQDLQSSQEFFNNPDNQIYAQPSIYNAYERRTKSIDEDLKAQKEILSQIEEEVNNLDLSTEESDAIKHLSSEIEKNNQVSDALVQAANCLSNNIDEVA